MKIVKKSLILVGVSCLLSVLFVSTAFAATYTVINTNDSGAGSLRQAIQDANGNAGADIIDFNIPAAPYVIQPASALPAISEAVVLDGYTQPGASANTVAAPGASDAVLLIELDGSLLGGSQNGLRINSTGITVKGLIINNFPNNGIRVNGDSNTIEGNYIGTDAAGTADSGNAGHGVVLNGVTGNKVGGNTPAARNVISGNDKAGVIMQNTSTTNTVEGNYIGTDVTGTLALGNSSDGVRIVGTSTGNTVGGGDATYMNVISANGRDGIRIDTSDTNVVRFDYIGSDVNGASALGNNNVGVRVLSSAQTNIRESIISANGNDGVRADASDKTKVRANKIGVDAAGTANFGNGNYGVHITNNSSRCRIGNTGWTPNIIAFNGKDGVYIEGTNSRRNRVRENSIFDNTELGIDIEGNGVNANDALDADTGANQLQNYPIIDSVVYDGSANTTISGSLNSAVTTTYEIEFFSNDAQDPSGYGEGKTYIGMDSVTTDGAGDATFTSVFAGDYSGKFVTATATAPNDHTSEFSTMAVSDLSVTNIVSNATPSDGDSINYTITVTNNGPQDATNIEVTDLLGGIVTFQSDTPSQGTYTSGTGVWNVGAIANGATATLTLNATVNSCGGFNSNADITVAGQFDTDLTNNSASVSISNPCPTPPVAGGRRHYDKEKTTEDTEDEVVEEKANEEESTKYCTDYYLEPYDENALTRSELLNAMLDFNCIEIVSEMPEGAIEYTDFPRDPYPQDPYEDGLLYYQMRAIYTATDKGIIKGYEDGTVKPFKKIVFAEAAKIIFKSAGMSEVDYSSGDNWYHPYMTFIGNLTGDKDIDPSSYVKKADVEGIMDKLMGN